MKTAILVDGGFYLRRAQALWGVKYPSERAKELFSYCLKHLYDKNEKKTLYRILFYDCPPSSKKAYHPLTQRTVDLGKSDMYKWSNEFHDCLRGMRKVALRLGKLNDSKLRYILRPEPLKKLCRGTITIDDLSDSDFSLLVDQKGVDMRIGLDISSMAYKRLVDQIVLISGDSDFVPAAKHARREGIDFILDPLRAPIKPELREHVDGIRSCFSGIETSREEIED